MSNGNPKDIFLQFRNLRLNLYAVYGLLARYYYYAHDNENAYAYAKKVVDIQERHFPWVKLLSLTGSNIDHMFSTEIMFALQNLQRDNLFTSLFNGNSLKTSSLLAPLEDVTTEIFGGTMASSDYRVRSSLSGTVEQGGKKYVLFNKYQGTDSLYNQMIPMIRVSESFLILAETGPDDEERLSRFTEFNNAAGRSGRGEYRRTEHTVRRHRQLSIHRTRKGMDQRVLRRRPALLLVQAQPMPVNAISHQRDQRSAVQNVVSQQVYPSDTRG